MAAGLRPGEDELEILVLFFKAGVSCGKFKSQEDAILLVERGREEERDVGWRGKIRETSTIVILIRAEELQNW